ncbi:MAG: RNA polymerase sigma factor [Bacteroidota bacterium]
MIELLRMKDHELADRCRRGDRDAQREVYNLFSGRMYAVCCRYVPDRDDAEDVLVSAFMKVFSGIGQFRHEGSFEGWIRRIMVNEALGFLRANRRFLVNTALEQVDREGTEVALPESLATSDLLELISELPDGYRMVFNLYVIDGYSHAEIASQLGISENTSKTQLAKARRRLQERIRALEEWSEKKIASDGRSV